jgi:hypothetical protein
MSLHGCTLPSPLHGACCKALSGAAMATRTPRRCSHAAMALGCTVLGMVGAHASRTSSKEKATLTLTTFVLLEPPLVPE